MPEGCTRQLKLPCCRRAGANAEISRFYRALLPKGETDRFGRCVGLSDTLLFDCEGYV